MSAAPGPRNGARSAGATPSWSPTTPIYRLCTGPTGRSADILAASAGLPDPQDRSGRARAPLPNGRGEAELGLADPECHDKGRLARVASYGRWRRVGILMSLTVCRAWSFCSSSAELLDHGVCDGLGTAGGLPRDQSAVLDDVGVKRLVGEGVLPTALLQVVLQSEGDGLAALSELMFDAMGIPAGGTDAAW